MQMLDCFFAESSGDDEILCLRMGGGSCLQSHEVARTEPVLSGADCDDMGGERHDSQAWTRELEPGKKKRGLPQGSAERPVIFTLIMEMVVRKLVPSWRREKCAGLPTTSILAAICCSDEVVVVAKWWMQRKRWLEKPWQSWNPLIYLWVGRRRIGRTNSPRKENCLLEVYGEWVTREEVKNFVESGVSPDGKASFALPLHTARHRQTQVWVPFWRRLQRLSGAQSSRDVEGAKSLAKVRRSLAMEIDQWWRLLRRSGYRWMANWPRKLEQWKRRKRSSVGEDMLLYRITMNRVLAFAGAAGFNGGVGDKHSGKILETSGRDPLRKTKIFRWEEATD